MPPRYRRATTENRPITPERNADWIEILATQLKVLEPVVKRVAQLDGDGIGDGRIGYLEKGVGRSFTSQGQRIGKLEGDHVSRHEFLGLSARTDALSNQSIEQRIELATLSLKTKMAIAAIGAGGAGAVELAKQLIGL